jgi:hypothetical protein
MTSGDIYTLTIRNRIGDNPTIEKDYCFLSSFDAKIQSSVLFLLSAEKDKKKPNKDFITLLNKELKTDLEYFTENSPLLQYLNKFQEKKNFYGEGIRYYKFSKK